MAIPQGVWGIDIGQCALKAIRLEIIEDQVTATAFDYVEHPKILSQPDADPDQLTREALETFLSRNTIKGDIVAMSIAGQSGLARFVKLPPVEEKKIADIVRFEAKQQIPFPLDEVVWDFQKIGSGVVTDGFAMDTEIGLFAMKRDMINRFLHHFQAVNVEVHIVQMAPLALCNYVAYDLLKKAADGSSVDGAETHEDTPPGKKRCAVALDIGTDGSSLIITDGQRIIWQRPIPIGGNHFTRALTKDLKLTFAKAEHLKRNAAKSPDLAKILKALKPVLTDFVNEVQRSLGYFTNTHRDAHVAFMVGLGSAFRLPGLQKFLSEKLSLEVRKPNSLERLTGDSVVSAPAFVENLLTFPVAYGLCLQGLKLSRLSTNLLPQEIQFDRMIRAKKPWSVGAAAALLLGIGVVSFGFGMKTQSLGQPINPETHREDKIASAALAAKDAIKLATDKKAEAEAKKQEITKTTSEVKSIIAGKDERSNWIRLNEFISKCLPKPDCSNLKDYKLENPAYPNQVEFKTKEAKTAAEEYLARLRGEGNVADLPLDDQSLQHLVNVDVEAIFTMYVDDLEAFYNKAKTETKARYGDPLSGIDRFTAPGQKKYSEDLPKKVPGWIVEIRGHTYQKRGRDFLTDTVVFNLNYLGYGKGLVPFDAPAAGAAPAANASNSSAAKSTDPIEGRVSHAFLFFAQEVKNPQPGTFAYINSSQLLDLVGGGGSSAAAGGSSGTGAAGFGGGTGTFTGGQSGGMGGSGTTDSSGPPSRSSWRPIGLGGSSSGAGAGMPGMGAPQRNDSDASKSNANRTRYEFDIMFVWREPVTPDNVQK
jgi:type IV pilus assembly protein PilM